jgi:putative DNA primase/helicase
LNPPSTDLGECQFESAGSKLSAGCDPFHFLPEYSRPLGRCLQINFMPFRAYPRNDMQTKSDSSTQVSRDGTQATSASPTNDEFLKMMFGKDLANAVVCSNTTAPDSPEASKKKDMWKVHTLAKARGMYKDPQRQNYTCISSFKANRDGSINRQQENFQGLHFVILDDIGTKVRVDPRTLGFGEPTCIIETSPGNCQWFYRLNVPVRDVSKAKHMMDKVLKATVQGHEMTDQGARGITRMCKLPQGMNLKLKLGTPWQNMVASWRPDLSYSAEEIAGWFGQSLQNVPDIKDTPAASTEQSSQHPLIMALRAFKLLKSSKPSNAGWWAITCPQVDKHTDQVDDGTAVMVRQDGSWTMKCQHGHCADLKPKDLYDQLASKGLTLPLPSETDQEMIAAKFECYEETSSTVLSTVNQNCKPTILLQAGELPRTMVECAKLLSNLVFKRSGYLVRIGQEPTTACGQLKMGRQPSVVRVTPNWLKRELAEKAMILKFDARKKEWTPSDCPNDLAKALEDGTDDITFKQLNTLSNVPFLREDGSVCEGPGYDEATGIFFEPSMPFPKLSEHPDHDEARAALDEILDLVKQFPFANKVSRSVFLADVLTGLARPTLPKSPMVLYTANMAGSGKTLLASIANLIAYGHATNHPWPNSNEDELRKVFTSVLMAGDPVIVFDNLPNGAAVKSAALAQFVTSEEYADRKLGESERLKFINRTRIVLTGNNVTLASDNARRTLVCELVLDVESLRDRKIQFDHPSLVDHIKRNRAKLIMSGLTVLRAYAISAERLSIQTLDSFEDWSLRVREALIWLGEEDPVAAIEYNNDGSGELGWAFQAIQKTVAESDKNGLKDFMASDLAFWAQCDPTLRDALSLAGCREPDNSSKVGVWLRQYKNRRAGGYLLKDTKQNSSGGVKRWSITSLADESVASDDDVWG